MIDPFGTVADALWIGGGQWAGKSTVARILAHRHGLTAYHYDVHDARGHLDRRTAARLRDGLDPPDVDPDRMWVDTTPEEMAADAVAVFAERFGPVCDDLAALESPTPVVAEGWGLRPDLVVPRLGHPERMVVLVPAVAFTAHQVRVVPRAGRLGAAVRDPERAQRNRLARDRLLAEDVARSARRYGVRVIEVDGSRDTGAVADEVAAHFAPLLPPRRPGVPDPGQPGAGTPPTSHRW